MCMTDDLWNLKSNNLLDFKFHKSLVKEHSTDITNYFRGNSP